jgi:hypothetical protein
MLAKFEGVVVTSRNPPVDGFLIKSPNPSDPNGGDLTLSSILADGDFVEFEIFGDFFRGHQCAPWLGPPPARERKMFR